MVPTYASLDLEPIVYDWHCDKQYLFGTDFAESEFWLAAIKVFAIIAFIVLGSLAIIGVIPLKGYSHAPGLQNFVKDGLFPTGFGGVFTTMLTVNFAFSGTELIGVTAGEAKQPEKTLPKAIHTTLGVL